MTAPVVVDRDALGEAIRNTFAATPMFPAYQLADDLIASGTVRTLADAVRELKTDPGAWEAIEGYAAGTAIENLADYLDSKQ